jgi:hypothetical protein
MLITYHKTIYLKVNNINKISVNKINKNNIN